MMISPESYSDASLGICIRLAREFGKQGVFVSVNKPYSTVKEELERSATLDKIVFVDCASRLAGLSPAGEKLVLINNPADLVEISVAISNALERLGTEGFLVFDSPFSLLIYNPEESLTKFVHTLSLRLKSAKFTGIFLGVEQEAVRKMMKFLSMVVDRVTMIDDERR